MAQGEGTGGLTSILTTVQSGVSALNNIGQIISNATINSSSLQVTINPVILPNLTKSTSADITLFASAYVDGPTVVQGSSGTWFASGTITINTSGPAQTIVAKLWDGTNIIAASLNVLPGTSFRDTISISGIITSPSGNIRISAQKLGDTGVISIMGFNQSGTSKDCTISVVRIG